MTERMKICNDNLTIRQTVATFPAKVSILLFFTFLTRLSFFMAWPFLSIILNRTYQLTPIAIGALMSGCTFISIFLGIYGGALSDRLGRKKLMIFGCLFAIVGYTSTALANNVLLFALGLLFISISFSWADVPGRALMSDLLQDRRRRELALQIRYFVINIAAVSGPLIGITVGLNSQKSTFLLTALSYIPFLFFSLFCLDAGKPAHDDHSDEKREESMGTWQVCRLILRDNVYVVVLISSILCYLVYSQIDSVVPQYFLMLDAARAVDLVTVLLVTNAITVVVAQLYLVPLLANIQLEKRIVIGALIMAFSQLLFWFNPSTSKLWWGGCAAIFSFAEAILLPNISILLDRLAPERYRGAYLGASTLVMLGLSLGRIIGGALLEWWGHNVFFVMSLLCLCVVFLLYANDKKIQKRLENDI
ncbi:Multidrug resistance protein MdtH [Serratia quinivorans]|uniref:MDR family MFS transporter n=1 Tax=Serratia quinivorans TaxID=137545 RepID=UPI00217C2986|nr:MFS transporter [Serratia quinivorans]CAI1900290.1 Multidrug resistance protein MdtH [Serratia quinivorans]